MFFIYYIFGSKVPQKFQFMHNLYFARENNQIYSKLKGMTTMTFKAQQVFGHSLHELSTLHQATHVCKVTFNISPNPSKVICKVFET